MKVFLRSLMSVALLVPGLAQADQWDRTVHCEKNAQGGGVHWTLDLLDDVGRGEYILRATRNGQPIYGPTFHPLNLYRDGRRSTWQSAGGTVFLTIDGNVGSFTTHFDWETGGVRTTLVSNLQCSGAGDAGTNGGGEGRSEGGSVSESALQRSQGAPGKPRPTCSIDDQQDSPSVIVEVSVMAGDQVVREVPVKDWHGHKVSAFYQEGALAESQTMLSLTVDDQTSRVFNVGNTGLYSLTGPGYNLHCAFK